MGPRQAALIGNGRLLVTMDSAADVLGVSWPTVDAPSQLRGVQVRTADRSLLRPVRQWPISERMVVTDLEGLRIVDHVLEGGAWVRWVSGGGDRIEVSFAPSLDGRATDQTVYFDETVGAMLAYHRGHWVGMASVADAVLDWECVVGELEDPVRAQRGMTRERIACGIVVGSLGLRQGEGAVPVFTAFGRDREEVLTTLARMRTQSCPSLDGSLSSDPPGGTKRLDAVLARSRQVIALLTNAETGGVLAGPPVRVDIPSEPGYAAVWARDAAWTMFGALAAGDHDRVRAFLAFAFRTQSPEGLWLHRHHTDYSLGTSWGLHQLDETGIVLHLAACYSSDSDDWQVAREHWDGVRRGADFLASAMVGRLPIPTIDLWEEREGQSLYAAASVVAGLQAAAWIAEGLGAQVEAQRWSAAARQLMHVIVQEFWSEPEHRFVRGLRSRSALRIADASRPDLAPPKDAATTLDTSIPSYPNWAYGPEVPFDDRADVSVLGLAVPFGLMDPTDHRLRATFDHLRQHLWVDRVGGYRRYEGDTYGGGNPWPLATLWVACYEAIRGNAAEAQRLLDWVVERSGPNGLVGEQVHRETGEPVAAFPMAWAHGMVLLTDAAIRGRRVWELPPG